MNTVDTHDAPPGISQPIGNALGPLALILALTLIRGLLYLVTIPPWQGPDEPRHFEYARLIADNRRLVTAADLSPALQAEILRSMAAHDFWRFGFAYYDYNPKQTPQVFEEVWPGDFAHQVHQPALYYIGAAVAALIMPGDDVRLDLYAMRAYSLVLGLLTIVVVYRAAAEMFPGDAVLGLGIPAFIAFLPMHTFLMSVVSNDNLAELLVTVVIWRAIHLLRVGFTWPRATGVMLWAVLATFSKLTALVAIPIALSGILFALELRWRAARDAPMLSLTACRRLLRWTLAVAGVAINVGVLLFMSAGSDHPLWSAPARFLRIPRDVALYLMDGDYARALLATPYGEYIAVMFRSFWGLFGWLNVPLPAALYWLLAGVTVLAALGLVRGFSRTRSADSIPLWRRRALWLCLLSPIVAIGIVLGKEVLFLTYLEGGLPHGRYLFPVILPIACLFVLGLREWVTAARRQAFLAAFLVGLFLLDAWALWGTIAPHYYG